MKIASQNYVTHTLHCARHLELCKRCGEPVPRDSFEEHIRLEHGTETCKTCGKTMDKGILDHHDCPRRPISCLYCDLELPSDEMIDHADYCGTRTEKCAECGEFVMLKYTQLHLDSNHKFLKLEDGERNKMVSLEIKTQSDSNLLSEPGPSASWEEKKQPATIPKLKNVESTLLPCEFCDDMYTPRELRRHQVSCTNGWDTAKPVLRRISTVKCRVCGKTIAANEYQAHLVVCEEEEFSAGASFVPAAQKNEENNGIPCDMCERIVPFEQYESHHRICLGIPDPSREIRRKDSFVPCDVCGGSIPFGDYQRHRIFCVKIDSPKRNSYLDSESKLPCEFCEKSFSEENLAAHQICCSPVGQSAEIPCEICGDLKSLIEVFEHQLTCRVSGNDY